ncbi:MAG TPA: hypothetical protein VKQ28_09935 [Candidatus Acidoferrum sp.]|nr:hypothetical protein [Candidatus Acidoferrum sp.]
MTVIIGQLHHDGVILAADMEETSSMKRMVSKLPSCTNVHKGSMIIGGAGPACYIDDITQQLLGHFANLTSPNWPDLEDHIRTRIKEYYNNFILRWPSPEERRNEEFSLLIGTTLYQNNNFVHRLWTSEKGTLRHTARHHAIGIGADYANILLDEIPWAGSLLFHVLLTIYILKRVKRHALYVGKESQVAHMTRKTVYVSEPLIERAEELFTKYDDAAIRTFVTTIMDKSQWEGFDNDADKTTLTSVQSLRSEFRELLKQLET